MTKEEITKEIKKIIDDDSKYTIEVIRGEDNELRAIIRFDDSESAKNFVETIKLSEDSNTIFKDVSYVSEVFSGSFEIRPLITGILSILLCYIQ